MSIAKNCVIKECDNNNKKYRFKRGMCQTHYRKWLSLNSVGVQRERMKPRPAVISGSIAKIPLGVDAVDGYTIVDKEFAHLANQYKFCLSDTGYAQTCIKGKTIKLHHLVIGKPQKNYVSDHINRDRLDNRKSNLRHITFQRNIHNAKGQPGGSGYKGVSKMSIGTITPGTKKMWRAYIKPYGKQLGLGNYETPEQAAKAYDKAAYKYWGEYAYLNFPEISHK